jgi:hypothetical protein
VTTNVASVAPAVAPRAAARFGLREAAVAGALGAAFLVRLLLAWRRETPNYFPDEYLYAALGRSLGGFDGATVRGHAAHFPALLQPLLTAPAWRTDSLETGYRVVQAIGAAAFTLVAVPVFVLARRLGLPRGLALSAAALALLVPDGLYAGLVVAEPLAYSLVLAALLAAVCALARPARGTQLAFLALALLAAFARVQFAMLPLCFVCATLVVGARERDVRRVLREQRLPLAAIGIACLGAAAVAAVRGLGYYTASGHVSVAPHALGANLTVLLYAGGWALAPGAVLGLALALWRPRSRVELAFATTTGVLTLALLLETTLWGDTTMVQERYLFYVLPLGALCFALHASRGWPYRRVHAVLALVLVALAARVPLAGYARPGADDHSPFLLAVQHLAPRLGNAGASTLVAALATVLALVAAAIAWRPRLATPVLLTLALCGSAAAFAGATAFDHDNSRSVLHRYLPSDRSWVDHAYVGDVTLVTAYGGRPVDAEEQLFWNRSLRRVAVLPGASPPDRLGSLRVRWNDRGELPRLHGPLAVDGYAGTIVLRDARAVASSPHFTLWLPNGTPRLAVYAPGRYFDGYVAPRGSITLWRARLAGWLELDVRALARTTLDLRLGQRTVQGGHVRIAVCGRGRWTLPFSARVQQVVGGRPVAGWMSAPRYVADASACR